MLVADASVIVKTFVVESGSTEASRILAGEELVIAPAHALAEVGEILCRKLRLEEVTDAQLDTAVTTLTQIVVTIPLDALLSDAIAIANETGASVYDTLYVACAIQHRCRVVTADRRLLRRMAGTAFAPVLYPLA